MKNNLANLLTILRILLIPIIIGFFFAEKMYIATLLFSLAAITDGLDGYLARYLHQTSSLGVWLDPVADKLIVISMLTLLLADPQFHHFIIPIIMMIGREVIVSALREWMAMIGQSHAVRVSKLGKWKTALQMMAIFMCLLSKSYPNYPSVLLVGYVMFYLATLLTLLSLMHYGSQVLKVMRSNTS